ncbi:unnamed protein product [Bemisia tabaci]|uniref:Carboxypeptidase n=1 Tax=Bemisia tabaci TaxID=7038 RepID=A0A7G3PE85_BEMTA|nr:venom serine carboxypeptidase-like protein [Bemisia tabaci]CAH0380500.1 unnamed protein product [Bemisia tabaci]
MKPSGLLVALLIAPFWSASGSVNHYRKLCRVAALPYSDVGGPLLLSPFIAEGRISEGQEAARVPPFAGNVVSYAGFLTVNETYNSNLFFWYFPAEKANGTTPLALWLQGGPGATSLFGLFEEHGPYYIDKKGQARLRHYSWTRKLSMLYIDNPVGTGFSFTDDDRGYVTNQEQVGQDLYSALIQFFQLFPELQKQDFYVTGESYAGKYVPAIAYTIHKRNPTAPLKINLKGLAIGNGLCDPEHMLGHYGDYLNQLGLLDEKTLADFRAAQDLGIKFIREGKWGDASAVFDKIINGDFDSNSMFLNASGFTFYFNYLHEKPPHEADFSAFVQSDAAREALHVGNATFHTDQKVETMLKDDLMKSVRPWVEELLGQYRVLIYNGQLDIIVAYPLTVGFLQALQFDAASEYKKAPRHIWQVGPHIAGYCKSAGNLTEILVRDAGHMVPGDQPIWALDMITRFTRNKAFHS